MRQSAGAADLPVDPDLGEAKRTDARVLVAIAFGGVLGASARYGVAQWIPRGSTTFPWATLWTNVTGSLLLGFALALLLERFPPARYTRSVFATGFLGSYTTLSTFAVEADLLVKDAHALTAGLYVASSLAAGVTAAALGIGLARTFAPAGKAQA